MKRRAALAFALVAPVAWAQSPPPTPAAPAAQVQSTTPQAQRDAEAEAERTRDAERKASRGPRTFKVTWHAPDELRALFEKHLPPPRPEETTQPRRGYIRPWVRDIRKRVPEIAAAEGYFSATVTVDYDDEEREHINVTVAPGPRTQVGDIQISFTGDISGDGAEREKRRQEILDGWGLKTGAPFRSADWDVAKTRIVEALASRDYAAAALAASEARVDAEASRASLKLVLDSGPAFTMGDVQIQGLDRYPEAVVRRLVDLQRGERYSADRLMALQKAVQSGPWFSSVVVDVERDAGHPTLVPVRVTVAERPRREVGLSLGYGTDDGARAEAAYRYRDLFDRGLDVQSSLRAAQKRQIGFIDVYMPPGYSWFPRRGDTPFQDSVGVLAEHSDIEGLRLSRFATAGYRHFKLDTWETRVGLSYQVERSYPVGSEPRVTRALAPIVAFTLRHVDDLYDPKRGGVLNLQVAVAKKSIASEQDFVRLYGQYQHWIPITARDQLLLRTEWGTTFAETRRGIPEDFLFRAGGSRSNRGYAYQSLGVSEGNAVVGGRYLLTGTAEAIHWLNERWGAAAFLDVGDAADRKGEWTANQSYGVGARFKTPAGPLALDLAYAENPRHFRLSFSVNVAF